MEPPWRIYPPSFIHWRNFIYSTDRVSSVPITSSVPTLISEEIVLLLPSSQPSSVFVSKSERIILEGIHNNTNGTRTPSSVKASSPSTELWQMTEFSYYLYDWECLLILSFRISRQMRKKVVMKAATKQFSPRSGWQLRKLSIQTRPDPLNGKIPSINDSRSDYSSPLLLSPRWRIFRQETKVKDSLRSPPRKIPLESCE